MACYHALPEINSDFQGSRNELVQEWVKYLQGVALASIELNGGAVDLEQFWELKSEELPHLSRLAKLYLQLPISNSEVERVFSRLKRLEEPLRLYITDVEVTDHLMIGHNAIIEASNAVRGI
jgi:Trp operon repressor